MTPTQALKQCRDALETAKNGLAWYRDRCPDAVDGSDDDASTEIDEAITSADAALSADPVDDAFAAAHQLSNTSPQDFIRGAQWVIQRGKK